MIREGVGKLLSLELFWHGRLVWQACAKGFEIGYPGRPYVVFKAVSTCEILKFCNPNIISNYPTAIGNRVFILQI